MDDDNYVNPSGLEHLLSAFSPNQDVYLGRPSLDHPIEATERVQGGGTVSARPVASFEGSSWGWTADDTWVQGRGRG